MDNQLQSLKNDHQYEQNETEAKSKCDLEHLIQISKLRLMHFLNADQLCLILNLLATNHSSWQPRRIKHIVKGYNRTCIIVRKMQLI